MIEIDKHCMSSHSLIKNQILSVLDKDCFCPSDCESTKYIFEVSFSPRSHNDTVLLIKSQSKKNQLMYNVKNQIEDLDDMCIHPDEKDKRIQELKQLNHSIAYSSTVLHFSWNIDTIISYKRDQRYTIEDMLCKSDFFSILVDD